MVLPSTQEKEKEDGALRFAIQVLSHVRLLDAQNLERKITLAILGRTPQLLSLSPFPSSLLSFSSSSSSSITFSSPAEHDGDEIRRVGGEGREKEKGKEREKEKEKGPGEARKGEEEQEGRRRKEKMDEVECFDDQEEAARRAAAKDTRLVVVDLLYRLAMLEKGKMGERRERKPEDSDDDEGGDRGGRGDGPFKY